MNDWKKREERERESKKERGEGRKERRREFGSDMDVEGRNIFFCCYYIFVYTVFLLINN